MRKQTKLVAVLSAAALLAIGASMTSFAATPHWTEEDGVWVYLDSDGERVTNEWKKSNGAWYYLDDNGEMSIDTWIDSDYYVGTDGKMITNNWAKLTPEDGSSDPDEEGEYWYYFDSKGKKISDETKTVNGKKYIFNTDGEMQHGWYQDNDSTVYYLGNEDDGSRKSGWLWLEVPDSEDVDYEQDDNDICDDEGWYWFDANGKLYKKSGTKTINGKKYYFNEHGQMLYNWVILATDSNAVNVKDDDDTTDASQIGNLRYAFDVEKGWRVDGWLKVDGSNTAGTQDDNNWYSFDDGDARKADNGYSVVVDTDARYRQKIKVDGKFFCFDQKGKMKTGLQAVPTSTGYDTYLFDDNGIMKTGKISNVELDNGDTATFYFKTSGANKGSGVTGEQDGYLYYKGKRLEADDDYKFYHVDGKDYLVNKSGKIQVYNKDPEASNPAAGKKIDSSKVETGNYTSDYIYVFTDNKGVIRKVYDNAKNDKDGANEITSRIDAVQTTTSDQIATDKEILGWED